MNYLRKATPMVGMMRRGMGQTACGTNPCTWWDDVYLTDACMAYTRCANPTSPLLTVVDNGLIVGGSAILGSTAGQAAGGALSSAASGFFETPDPITGAPSVNWTSILTMGAIGLGLFIFLPALVKR